MTTNLVLDTTGTAIVIANSTHSPAAGSDLGSRTGTDDIDLTSLAAASYRQSTKVDFGATRGSMWEATGAFEPVSAPAAGGEVELWISYSHSATAATGNAGNASGADGAYVGYGAANTDADECVHQLQYIGSYPVSADSDIHIGHFGDFRPIQRYGSIVVRNSTSVAAIADAVEMSIRLSPIEDQIQAAV